MNKVILMALALLLILSCVGLIACGSKGSGESTTAAAKTTAGQTAVQTTVPSGGGGGGTWLDVPIYPGAKLLMDQTFNNPNDRYSKESHRVYESTDSLDKVAAFYKSGMPANGWTETIWSQVQVLITAQYEKNNKKDFAAVTVGYSKDKTTISLTRDY
jgi:predicted small lipoprotein YifL